MIDKLIASDLAALAREDQQRIPAFVPPVPRAKAVSFVVTAAHALAVAPTIAVLAFGAALLALDTAPFGHYETFVMPLIIAVASFVGLLAASPHGPAHMTTLRAHVVAIFVGGMLVIGTISYVILGWPTARLLTGYITDDGLYALTEFAGTHWVMGPGFVLIAATACVLLARLIASRTKPVKRTLEAWGTSAAIIGVLVIVVWANLFDFETRGWRLVPLRLPDPSIATHLVAYTKANMWFALTFRPWSRSALTDAQWDLCAAMVVVLIVALASGVAIAREQRSGRRSRWLRLLELPAVLPLFVIIGMANLARAIMADWPGAAGRPFAWAVGGVMLAFTSMILRRRRRREALS